MKIYAKYVQSADNELADSLSRGQMKRFQSLTANEMINEFPCQIPNTIWPMQQVWVKVA